MTHLNSSSRLLVIGAGSEVYRSWGLEQIAAFHPVTLVDRDAPAWARRHVGDVVSVDLRNYGLTLAAVTSYAREHRIAGVVTYAEQYTTLTASLARDLGLPGTLPSAVAAARDKGTTRRLLAQHGVPSARSLPAGSTEDAVEAARLLGYPVVVKPRGLGGSAGVRRADSDAQVRTAYDAATRATLMDLQDFGEPGVLVEEYLDGPEISVETVVTAPGEVRIVAVTRKFLGPEPGFQEIGHIVDVNDPLLGDTRVAEVTEGAVAALGITRGTLHIEMRQTVSGPRVIEVNARFGGDLIPLLVQLATGVNLPQAAAALAMGITPDLQVTAHGAAGIHCLYPAAAGRVDELHVGDIARRPWLKRFAWTQRPGAQVAALTSAGTGIGDRLALWVAVGATAGRVEERLRMVADDTSVRITAFAHSGSCTR
ncbi:ATP-grasp domain-containing protein [Streptomyces sp. NPDC056672]|uniref:ATP-grasp domain-containing protein n=1 Tax=Streptomyces sp. NPDC056672 TaxID=3345906 RepID=UPI00369C4C24